MWRSFAPPVQRSVELHWNNGARRFYQRLFRRQAPPHPVHTRPLCSAPGHASSHPVTNLARGLRRQRPELAVGAQLHGYRVDAVQTVPELRFDAIFLTHEVTGARHVHIDTPDENNVFGVAFRTVSHNSTGIAHILEHTALCGSTRFPVRDPFFKMTRRSLNSYMNALTGDDYTCVSTRLHERFYTCASIWCIH